jgi:hypothetical protein
MRRSNNLQLQKLRLQKALQPLKQLRQRALLLLLL